MTRAQCIEAATRALAIADAASDRAVAAMKRGDIAEARFQNERRDLWARRANAHMDAAPGARADIKKSETITR